MNWKILTTLLLLLQAGLFAQSTDLETALFELPDVVFKAIDTPSGYEEAYEVRIKQPLDHKNPDKGYFYQRAYLSHRGFDRPTVICTEGYGRGSNRIYELTNLIDGNQIDVEHRYFGESMPDTKELDYQYLNLE